MPSVPLFLLTFFSKFKKNFNLNAIPETYFWKSQFEDFDPRDFNTPVSPYYVIYRFVYMLYFVVTLLTCFTCLQNEDYFYPVYLTNQTICLQFLYAAISFCYVLRIKLSKKFRGPFNYDKNHLPFIAKLIWILMNVVYTVPYVVSLVYWTFLSDDRKEFKDDCRFRRNYFTHALNAPAALIDAVITSVPIKFSHFVFPLVDALLYSTFSLTYEVSGAPLPENATSVYTILYWKSPEGPGAAFLTCTGAMAAGLVLFTILCWGLSRVKFIAARYLNCGPEQIPTCSPDPAKEVPTESANGIKLSTLEPPSLDPNGYFGTQNPNPFREI